MNVFNVTIVLFGCIIGVALTVNIPYELCKKGSAFQVDCNICECVPDVGYSCSKNICSKQKREQPVENEFKGTSCAPNDKFKIDCNTCFCNKDGSGYSCTEKQCAEPITTNVKT